MKLSYKIHIHRYPDDKKKKNQIHLLREDVISTFNQAIVSFLITSLVNYKNGDLKIKRHYVSPNKIDGFLGFLVERNDHMQEYDEDRDTCDCPQLESSHYYEQHNPLKKINRQAFEKQVQKRILNELHLGLKFE